MEPVWHFAKKIIFIFLFIGCCIQSFSQKKNKEEIYNPYLRENLPFDNSIYIGLNKDSIRTFSVPFYGNICNVRFPSQMNLRLDTLSKDIFNAEFKKLRDDKYNFMLVDLLLLRDKLNLCDWAFIQLIRKTVDICVGKDNHNEKALLQFYILEKFRIMSKLAYQKDKLFSIIAFREVLHGDTYLQFNGVKYYFFDKFDENGKIRIWPVSLKGYRVMTAQMTHKVYTPSDNMFHRRIQSDIYPDLSIDLFINQNDIDFLKNYAHCGFEQKAKVSLSKYIKDQLYPVLKRNINGLNDVDAVNLLLHFVQTCFDYKTDMDYYGYVRSLFPDETLYYPYIDCEDRSLLFSILVKDLLGLEVLLLNYPKHIATAVKFKTDVIGDYFIENNEKYIICDPTHIGASIGDPIPECDNQSFTIMHIDHTNTVEDALIDLNLDYKKILGAKNLK